MPSVPVDRIGLWWKVIAEMGECLDIVFGKVSGCDTPGKQTVKWQVRSHVEFDGVGGLLDILRKENQLEDPRPMPALQYGGRLSGWRLMRFGLSYQKERSRCPASRISFRDKAHQDQNPGPVDAKPEGRPMPTWHVFDKTGSAAIASEAKKQNLSVNTLVLNALCRALWHFMEQDAGPLHWMIPVNMRGKIVLPQDTANCSSFLDLSISPQDSMHGIQQRIKARLAENYHFGIWQGLLWCAGLGKAVRKYFADQEAFGRRKRFGSFSNLGVWNCEARDSSYSSNTSWVFCPPMASFQPFGAGCITFNQRLSISCQAHSILGLSKSFLVDLVARWVQELSEVRPFKALEP